MHDVAVGIDVHKSFLQVAVCTSSDVLVERRIGWTPEALEELRELIRTYSASIVVVEACTGAKHLCEQLRCVEVAIIVADPAGFRQRFPKNGQKTDRIDAINLARYGLFHGKGVWIPPSAVQEHRELVKLYCSTTAQSTQIKNRIQALLKENGIRPPCTGADREKSSSWLWTQTGQAWLDTQLPYMKPMARLAIEQSRLLLSTCAGVISTLTDSFAQIAVGNETIQRLMTHPGVGVVSAFIINAEVGDFSRFSSAKKLVSYAGIAPSVSQTGFSCHTGSITKRGNARLRWIVVEAGTQARRQCLSLEGLYKRIKRRTKISGKALVAVGRKLLIRLYHMVMTGTDCKDGSTELLQRKMRALTLRAQRKSETIVARPAPARRRLPQRATSPPVA